MLKQKGSAVRTVPYAENDELFYCVSFRIFRRALWPTPTASQSWLRAKAKAPVNGISDKTNAAVRDHTIQPSTVSVASSEGRYRIPSS